MTDDDATPSPGGRVVLDGKSISTPDYDSTAALATHSDLTCPANLPAPHSPGDETGIECAELEGRATIDWLT